MRSLARYAVLLILATFVCVLTANAQRMGRSIDDRVKDMTIRLKLTDDQAAKVKDILTASREEMMKIRDEQGDDMDAMRAAMRAQTEKTDKQIGALLTDDQKKEYAKMKAEREEQMRKRMQQQGGN